MSGRCRGGGRMSAGCIGSLNSLHRPIKTELIGKHAFNEYEP